MPWVKLDDGFYTNKKVLLAGLYGRALYITALCHAADQLTDGFVDARLLPMLASLSEVPDVEAAAERLVEVGLWERVQGGFVIHDYLEYNPSKQETVDRQQAVSDARSHAGSIGAQRRWQTDGKRDGKPMANGMANAWQTDGPVPGPIGGDDDLWDVRERLELFGIDPTVAAELVQSHAADCISGWLDHANGKKLKNPAGYVVSRIRSGRSPPEVQDPVLGGDGKRYTRGKYAHLIQH